MMRLSAAPLTVKVPLLVAALMIVVSVAVSQRVMSKLIETQERQLKNLAETYLDALSSSLVPPMLRDDMWEVFDILDRSRRLYRALRPVETVVVNRNGIVIASTDPLRTPSLQPLPGFFAQRLGTREIAIAKEAGRAYVQRQLVHQALPLGAIYMVVDIRHLLAERTNVVATLVATNALLTLLLATIGYWAVRRMIAPMRVLADHLTASADREPQAIAGALMPPPGCEARRLFDAYNRLVESERQRRELMLRLAEEERLASLGRLASGMAHEINNPLGGLFNALDMLKRHGAEASVRASAIRLLERGLKGIRDVVRATLDTYRPERTPRPFAPADIDDVMILIGPEAQRKRLRVEKHVDLAGPINAPSAPLRQALLNLALNATAASAKGGTLNIAAAVCDGVLRLDVSDSGKGLPASARAILLAEGGLPAPLPGSGGLGLWLVSRAVSSLGGRIGCGKSRFGGARIWVEIPLREQKAGQEHADTIA